ncbi:2-oxo-4-hydroxy-4-carboxy-5-ureidoimidazoline decarboxylase [Streptomyces sioyaensis]|uniref:2-oxo-4-hydroxy-4-carboxy-5-ureidoimidazoline decarboxylase n=1 Tax=Streptomyces sioyaensis TaxID=67364 RepID=UPI0037D5C2A2
MASPAVTPFTGLSRNRRIPPGCRVTRITVTPSAASSASRLRSASPQLPSAARPAPVETIHSHPSEEPTLSGDTPAARPPTLPPPHTSWGGISPWVRGTALPRPRTEGLGLARFNALTRDDNLAVLLRCCGSRRWAERVAAHRPYPDLESLLAASDEACYDLNPAELDEALAEESLSPLPLVGARGPGTLAAHTALRAAHAEYERRFRHVFVICLDGYRDDELLDQVLSALRTRLNNEADEEQAVTADELRRLARGRLKRLMAAVG